MSYATQQDMIDRFGEATLVQLTDRAGTGEIDEDALARALADAGAIIDSYVSRRYDLPLPATPPLLTQLAADLALYKLHPHGAPEELRARARSATEHLRAIAEGKARLDLDGAEPASAAGEAVVEGPERVFSRKTTRGL